MSPVQRRRWSGFAAGCLLPMAALAVPSQTYVLSYTTGVSSLDVPIDLQEREIVFRREPDFGGRSVIRGAVVTGSGRTNFVGFAIDLEKRTLYVDRNRNLDLTDDPPRTLTSEEIPGYVHFENVTLDLPVGGTTVPYVFDVACYGSGSHASCDLTCRSGWQGEVAFGGGRWTLGVIDNLDGIIDGADMFILRKRSGTTEESRASEADRLPATTNLCVDGQAVSLAFSFKRDGGAVGLEVAATPAAIPTGSLRIEGAGIRRVVMFGPSSVVLESRATAVEIPAGRYETVRIYVRDEDSPVEFLATRQQPLRVAAGGATALKAGGPLRNCIRAVHDGAAVTMSYELKGIDGLSYRAESADREHAPRFLVRRGGSEVASGSFEYG